MHRARFVSVNVMIFFTVTALIFTNVFAKEVLSIKNTRKKTYAQRNYENKEILDFILKYSKIKINNDQFETSKERFLRILNSGFLNKEFIVKIPSNRGFRLEYDSDAQVLTIGLIGTDTYKPYFSLEKKYPQFLIYTTGVYTGGNYMGVNAFGLKRNVRIIAEKKYSLLFINIDSSKLASCYDYAESEAIGIIKQLRSISENSINEKYDLINEQIIQEKTKRLNQIREDRKNKLLQISIKLDPKTARHISTYGLWRLYIKTSLHDDQMEYILKRGRYNEPRLDNPIELKESELILIADLLKAELIDPDDNKVYASFEFNKD